MRGRYHRALRGVLERASKAKLFTQESLAEDLGREQTGIGKYLKDKAGPLDLDEAEIALKHVGIDLKDFVADPALVAPDVDLPVLVQRLLKDDLFQKLVITLAGAPSVRRRRALGHLVALAAELTRSPRGGSSGASDE